ncbi:MAG: phosphotransferase [Candidatus Rokubacteria bacterium]|nr:phosphotransferase [Candidatus Rokubacteria bacterium]
MNSREALAFLEGDGMRAGAAFLARQRWFAARGTPPQAIRVLDAGVAREAPLLVLALLDVDGDRYFVPVAAEARATADVARTIVALGREEVLTDAVPDPALARLLLTAMAEERAIPGARGRFECRSLAPWQGPAAREPDDMPVRLLSGEQSNSSLLVGNRLILKILRRPPAGTSPDVEMTRFLGSRTGFTGVPGLVGWIDHVDETDRRSTLAMLQPFVPNQGDGWAVTLAHLRELCARLEAEPRRATAAEAETRLRAAAGDFPGDMRGLGRVIGELHGALASDASDPDFRPEPIAQEDVAGWGEAIADEARAALAELRARAPAGDLPAALESDDALADALAAALAGLALLPRTGAHRIRTHGDLHLGQVLRTPTGFVVIDFEGEPARPLALRRAKHCALRDVAGMLRSFDYARHTVLGERPPTERDALAPWLERWEHLGVGELRAGYLRAVRASPVRLVPAAEAAVWQVTAAFELEKAFYELRYELHQRPDWVPIPLAGITRILRGEDPARPAPGGTP